MADAPAAVLPDGNVLCETSPGIFKTPLTFYEFNGKKFTKAPLVHNSGSPATSYQGRFLGASDRPGPLHLGRRRNTRTPRSTPLKGTYKSAWQPTITTPTSVTRGDTYKISGNAVERLDPGAAYGDDAQMNSNYALVRQLQHATSHVFYAKPTTPALWAWRRATGRVDEFDVPASMETGCQQPGCGRERDCVRARLLSPSLAKSTAVSATLQSTRFAFCRNIASYVSTDNKSRVDLFFLNYCGSRVLIVIDRVRPDRYGRGGKRVRIPRCRATVSEEIAASHWGNPWEGWLDAGRNVGRAVIFCPHSRSQETGANRPTPTPFAR